MREQDNSLFVKQLVEKGDLYESLLALQNQANAIRNPLLQDKIQGLIENYKYLLQYFATGTEDPKREEVKNKIERETIVLHEELSAAAFTDKIYNEMVAKAAEYIPQGDRYSFLRQIFYNNFAKKELSFIDYSTSDERAMFVSAIGVNLSKKFNEQNFLLLCSLADNYTDKEQIYALTWLLVLTFHYQYHLKVFGNIEEQIRHLSTNKQICETVKTICYRFINTALTQQASEQIQQMSSELYPKLEKNSNLNLLIEIDDTEEMNPLWDKDVQDVVSKYANKVMQLQEMGADFNFGHISQFFWKDFFKKDIANWFMPFGLDNPDIQYAADDKHSQILKMMLYGNTNSSDIDKYAFCMMLDSLKAELNKHKFQIPKDEELNIDNDLSNFDEYTPTDYAQSYVSTLYRFFYRNFWIGDNMMKSITKIAERSLVRAFFTEEELDVLGDYCLNLKLYEETIVTIIPHDASTYQKVGFACERTGKIEEAIDYYRIALLAQNDAWTNIRLANCYQIIDEDEHALEIYDKLLIEDGNSKKILLHKAQSLMKLNRYQDALQVFYQLDILYPNNINIWRGLVWSTISCNNPNEGEMSIAQSYMEKITTSKDTTANDLINFGHLLLITHHRKEAIEQYLKAVELVKSPTRTLSLSKRTAEVKAQIIKDKDLLLTKGISKQEIQLINDTILVMMQ